MQVEEFDFLNAMTLYTYSKDSVLLTWLDNGTEERPQT